VFTTRPELRGTFGMVASTHWLASQTGMAVLERGGNAFDAAVATGFVLQVVEPHLNGPGGELPALFWSVDRGEPLALCGQGVAPAAATIERFHELGHELIPGTGVLAACVPGSFGGWLLLLREFGTWRLADVLEFAIGYAERGYPLHERIRATIVLNEELIASWPGSRDLYLPAPTPGTLFRNPALAATYRRIVDESRGGSREDELEKARLTVVVVRLREIGCRDDTEFHVPETLGDRQRAAAGHEPVVSLEYRGLTVCKTLPWAAGPVGLQQLALLQGYDLAELSSAEFVHVVELTRELTADERPGREQPLDSFSRTVQRGSARSSANRPRRRAPRAWIANRPRVMVTQGGEPTRGHCTSMWSVSGMVSATPSGGWLRAPVIRSGWPLGTRAQMFWLEEGLPSSLQPRARPERRCHPGSRFAASHTSRGERRRRPAGAVGDASSFVTSRHEPPGGDRRARIHTDHLISSFFPAASFRGHSLESLRLSYRRRPPAPRARSRCTRRGRSAGSRRRTRARRPAARGCERAACRATRWADERACAHVLVGRPVRRPEAGDRAHRARGDAEDCRRELPGLHRAHSRLRLVEVEHGHAVLRALRRVPLQPIGTVRRLAATLLDSAMGCALVDPPACDPLDDARAEGELHPGDDGRDSCAASAPSFIQPPCRDDGGADRTPTNACSPRVEHDPHARRLTD
jgi:gamma-glutamyltranspeptidase/glutathione hydrolase